MCNAQLASLTMLNINCAETETLNVKSCLLDDEWSGIPMPFEYCTKFSPVFRPPFEYWTGIQMLD